MLRLNEQLLDAARMDLQAQLSIVTELSTNAIETFRKVVDLNLDAAIASTKDSAAAARQFLAAKGPHEVVSVTVAHAQPAAANAIAYNLHLAAIAAATHAEIARAAEEQIVETDRKVSALVDGVSKNSPSGSENMMEAMKTAIGDAGAGYQRFSKTAKQALVVMEESLRVASDRFSEAGDHTAGAARAVSA